MSEDRQYPDHIGVSDVRTVSHEMMRVEAFMDGQPSICADEPIGFDIGEGDPPALRGQSRGWTPVHYQLAGLATCTSITIRVVALDQGFALDSLSTSIRSLIDIRGFCDGDTTRQPTFELIAFDVVLDTPEPDSRVEALAAETDRRCPQLGVYHRAQIPMHVRWLRRGTDEVICEQRFALEAGRDPALELAHDR
jgi:uncharacterized OsmC-like protein